MSKLTWNLAKAYKWHAIIHILLGREVWIKIITSTIVNDYMNYGWMDICIVNF